MVVNINDKTNFFDDLETRSEDERNSNHLNKLNLLINAAKNNKNQSIRLNNDLKGLDDLVSIPVSRKSDLILEQQKNPPFANLNVSDIKNFAHIYRSPGPIYDLDGHTKDWWRFSKILFT
ncbi:hypothetical protein N9835_00230 [Alphaproteobacteria bacterium]|nr:hypothetical protein [Alphaproteobacteria bacterium]